MLSADLIREARLRAGITQAELGRRIGRSQSQVARWERGAVTPSFRRNLALSPAERLDDADDLERGYEQLRRAGAAARG